MAALSLLIFSLIITSSLCIPSLATTTITAMARDQISCTVCSSCDNPCQPYLSPPPGPLCPPPPSLPSGGGGVYYYSPPPPAQTSYYYPPPDANPSAGFPTPPPPNPITQYYPFYFHNPTPFNSAPFKSHSIFPLILILISLFLPL